MKTLSIIIPSFNEEKYLARLLKKIVRINERKLGYKLEIILVDDGSVDNTKNIVKKFKKVRYLYQKNFGKGRAVQNGIKRSKGDYVLIQDADLEYNPNDYYNLCKKITKGNIAIYGSRYFNHNKLKHPKQNFGSFIANLICSALFFVLFQRFISDMMTGYKIYKSNFFKNVKIKTNGFETDHEISAKLIKKGYNIIEVPIRYNPRSYKAGKKINFFDGIKALITILYFRLFD